MQDKLPGAPLPLTTCPAGELVTSLQTTLVCGATELAAVTIGLPTAKPDGTMIVPAQAAAEVAVPATGKQAGAAGGPRAEAAQAAVGAKAVADAPAALVPTAHQLLQLPAGVYVLLFSSPGVATGQLVVNLMVPVVKGAAGKGKAAKE